MKKKLVTLLLAGVCAFEMVGLAACSSTNDKKLIDASGSLTYKLSEDGTYYVVSGYTYGKNNSAFEVNNGDKKKKDSIEIVIPAEVDGKPIREIGSHAFSFGEEIVSITLPDGILSIGDSAFGGCTGLTSVNIPDSVVSVGGGAFNNCAHVIQTENGVSYVGKWAIGRDVSASEFSLRADTRGIAGLAFYKCEALTSIAMPDSVITVGRNAFEDCKSLTEVTISGGATRIEEAAFKNCSKLTSVSIPDSVISIETETFYSCDRLASVTIGDSVTTIGWGAFQECTELTKVVFGASVTSIGKLAFNYCIGLTNIIFPEGLNFIGNSAFRQCGNLESVIFPDRVETIEGFAFDACKKLATVYYTGNAESWQKITMDGTTNASLTNARRYYYSETEAMGCWRYVDGVPTLW